ncbi:MAG: hypothetical protein H8E55_09430 [Pelagibacterales bacterium]|nr:hypothetical protein [Pelagibacterales bacterium]
MRESKRVFYTRRINEYLDHIPDKKLFKVTQEIKKFTNISLEKRIKETLNKLRKHT